MKRRPIYYDTETTGIKPGKDRVIEIAAFDAESNLSFCTLINPERPIPSEATAISNITDEMVRDAPLIRDAIQAFAEFCSFDALLIAHNNDAFDRPFLEAEFARASLQMPDWIFFDTLRWSRKYRSDLPRHNLQFLREVYGIEKNQAHRALDDVKTLHQLFSKMTDDLPWTVILELLEEVPRVTRMPFGKYAGKSLTELPKDYVAWLHKSGALDKKENASLREAFKSCGAIL